MQAYNILKDYEQTLLQIEDIIGISTTTNIQLNNFCKKIFGEKFIGVFSANEMPLLKNKQMCIINNQSNKQPGEHWLGAYKYKNKTFIYDTFDRDVKSLSRYWKHKHNWYNVNKFRTESFKDRNCGQHSITFLIIFDKYKLNCIGVI
jgi:hypothetical protein